jgi:hypothetical protein
MPKNSKPRPRGRARPALKSLTNVAMENAFPPLIDSPVKKKKSGVHHSSTSTKHASSGQPPPPPSAEDTSLEQQVEDLLSKEMAAMANVPTTPPTPASLTISIFPSSPPNFSLTSSPRLTLLITVLTVLVLMCTPPPSSPLMVAAPEPKVKGFAKVLGFVGVGKGGGRKGRTGTKRWEQVDATFNNVFE